MTTSTADLELAELKQRIANVLELYKGGKPLFSRSSLEDLDRQLAENKEHVRLEDYEGNSKGFSSLKPPYWCADRT